MSRPFSYNDENFTVIGNILFLHVNILSKAYSIGDKLGTIPPAIYDRMTTVNLQGCISNNAPGGYSSFVSIYVDANGNIITNGNISITSYMPRMVFGYYLLKDI